MHIGFRFVCLSVPHSFVHYKYNTPQKRKKVSKGLQKGYKKTTKGLQREFSFEKGAVVSDVAIHSSALQIVTYFLSIEQNDSDNSGYR